MKVLMFYKNDPAGRANVRQHFPGNPPVGALGVFTTREAAEEFVKDDPFVVHGVVARYHLHEWNEVLA